MSRYEPADIEKKWQERWLESGINTFNPKPEKTKYYALTMLPYPSGDMHIGHWYAMTPSDAHARYKRMRGFDVFFPMGFDGFGLPAENAAIKNNIHPKVWTYANIEHMRRQMKSMGLMVDWGQQVVTCDPEYYRWNQWFFIQFYKNDLAYRKFAPVDWCPSCQTTLAREQVKGDDRHCDRCGTAVIKKDLDQWLFKITNYADRLLEFDGVEWPDRIMTMQRNWIGRSEGATIVFTTGAGDAVPVFTTRPDTVWGATFLVLAPEHILVDSLVSDGQRDAVATYRFEASRASEIERLSTERPKTGVWTGGYATNPATGQPIPVWIADYVLMGYGSGAIMAVPAHDQRDLDFANSFGLPVVVVVSPADDDTAYYDEAGVLRTAIIGSGVVQNSGPLNGLIVGKGTGESVQAAISWLVAAGKGELSVNYRLRDWLISRQRYWGTPIPMVYCVTCGPQPVPEDQLPVLLPDDIEFVPTGQSPLKLHPTWRFTTCPLCNGPAERDTDTMDTFVDSSWYQMRYLSPHDADTPITPDIAKAWLPVDQYTGGAEHAVMHLLYTRFWTKAMYDLGLIHFQEPMLRLINQGFILGEDNEKMSKSRGNVIDPDALVAKHGADAVRLFLMFLGPWDQGAPWNSRGIEGIIRFLNRVWTLVRQPRTSGTTQPDALHELRRMTHATIKRVGEDVERFSFNTAIAGMMEYLNALSKLQDNVATSSKEWQAAVDTIVLLLAPFAPHIAEEMWALGGHAYSVHQQPWPAYDPRAIVRDTVTLVVQVNGKVRDRATVAATISADEAREVALAMLKVQEAVAGKDVRDVIMVPGRLVNVVTS